MQLLKQLAVPVVFCLLVGCSKPTITIEVLANGKLMTYVPKGTTVKWVNENNQPLTVTFLPDAIPCSNGNNVSSCIVENGQGIYQCQGGACEDPGIGVVPTTKTQTQGTITTNVAKGTAKLQQVLCNASGNASGEGFPVNPGDLVSWTSTDNKDYTLSQFSQANACTPGTISKGVVCTVGNTIGDVTYQVQFDACTGNKTGTGTLHIQTQ